MASSRGEQCSRFSSLLMYVLGCVWNPRALFGVFLSKEGLDTYYRYIYIYMYIYIYLF